MLTAVEFSRATCSTSIRREEVQLDSKCWSWRRSICV